MTCRIRACRPLFSAFIAVAALTTGCAAINELIEPKPPPVVVTPARLTPAERNFVAKAFTRSVYEVEVSRLAAERAIDPRVRSYAQTLVEDRSDAREDLIRIMSAKGISPPKGLPADKATKLHRLAALKPSAAFDQGYVRVVGIEDHAAAITMFENARRQAVDPDLRAWIDKSLAAMRRQLSVAQNLEGSITG
jgi:putative membrane protein